MSAGKSNNDQLELKKMLDSIVEVNASTVQPILKDTKILNGNNAKLLNKEGNISTPIAYVTDYSKNRPIRSMSSDQDEAYMDTYMNAQDRRASWQQVRSQKSFAPSLSAICKLLLT